MHNGPSHLPPRERAPLDGVGGHTNRRILMLYPQFEKSHWGMQYSLPYIGKKSIIAPLGLMTVAALTPPGYQIRLVDLNCDQLTDRDLEWADMVCFSAMIPQRRALFEASKRCRAAGKFIVFGGPFPTACPEECEPYCDTMVLNEGEIAWPAFLSDFEKGICQRIYTSDQRPSLKESPIPRYDLLNINDYVHVPVQFSRGCPYDCEFCDITVLFGRRPRYKAPRQILAELDTIYQTGHRGSVFFVDDNFIGNKKEVMQLLPELAAWNVAHNHPFHYATQLTMNLADDESLMRQMVEADFLGVFIGIETPNIESLRETGKFQNMKNPLIDSITRIQRAGLVVHGSFVLGFDHDSEDIFERQIELISQAALPVANVALLYALPGTRLHARLGEAGRLKETHFNDDYNGYDSNIVTILPEKEILEGHVKILKSIYLPRAYFGRALETFLRMRRPPTFRKRAQPALQLGKIIAAKLVNKKRLAVNSGRSFAEQVRSFWALLSQVPPQYQWASLKFVSMILRRCPERILHALFYVHIGIHYYKYTFEDLIPYIRRRLAESSEETAGKSEQAAA